MAKNLQGSVSAGGKNSKPTGSVKAGAVMRLRTNKPPKAKLSKFRKVDGGWKRRKFTASQRQTFRSRKGGPTNLGGPR